MSSGFEKLLFSLSFIIIHLSNSITVAQPEFLDYFCENKANYTTGSVYQKNLKTTLSILPSTNSGFGFYNSSIGTFENKVNSVALCRGDVDADVCKSCLNDSIGKLRKKCPNQKEAVGYYDQCYLKYSNKNILGSTKVKFYLMLWNLQNATNVNKFNGALRRLMDELKVSAASGGPLMKFASGNTAGPDFTMIYALVQCTPDLSKLQCSDCLKGEFNLISTTMNGKVGGRVLLPTCNFRYEIYRFYNESTFRISPSPSSSPPQASLQPPTSAISPSPSRSSPTPPPPTTRSGSSKLTCLSYLFTLLIFIGLLQSP